MDVTFLGVDLDTPGGALICSSPSASPASCCGGSSPRCSCAPRRSSTAGCSECGARSGSTCSRSGSRRWSRRDPTWSTSRRRSCGASNATSTTAPRRVWSPRRELRDRQQRHHRVAERDPREAAEDDAAQVFHRDPRRRRQAESADAEPSRENRDDRAGHRDVGRHVKREQRRDQHRDDCRQAAEGGDGGAGPIHRAGEVNEAGDQSEDEPAPGRHAGDRPRRGPLQPLSATSSGTSAMNATAGCPYLGNESASSTPDSRAAAD